MNNHIFVRIVVTIALAAGSMSIPGLGIQALAGQAESHPLTLDEAVDLALRQNAELRAAEARTDAAEDGARMAESFLYPMVGVEAGTVRSNDPVAAFGSRLRQGRFTQSDFALDALNSPDPITDWSALAGAQWSILDAASWARREAATLGAEAARFGLERRRDATVFQTRVLYYQALQGLARLEAAQAGEEAAAATVRLFTSRRDQGLLTDADVLQAEAELAGARAGRLFDEQLALDARSRLGVFLGLPADRLPLPTDTLLSEGMEIRTPSGTVEERDDLLALDRMVKAAGAQVSLASRSGLPGLEVFGQVSTHTHETFGSREGNWTVGLQLRWPVFTGFARRSALDAAREQRRAVEIEREQAVRSARAEVGEAVRGVESAQRQVEAMDAAAAAAAEARRLVERRFQEGLATAVDLLQAEARVVEMRTRAVDARASYRIAVARLEFVGS